MESKLTAHFDISALSRMHATTQVNAYQFTLDYAQPAGDGVMLTAEYDGHSLQFWLPEAAWCRWLQPHLVVPNLHEIATALLPLLAAWTLTPLNDWLVEHGYNAMSMPSATPAPAAEAGWCITLKREGDYLPMWLSTTAEQQLRPLFTRLKPSKQQQHTLGLALGWCLVPRTAITTISPGDALKVVGLEDDLDTFWLHPVHSPGQLKLVDRSHALILPPTKAPVAITDTMLYLAVEAGCVDISAADLAAWEEDYELAVKIARYPLLNLTQGGEIIGQGELLKLDNIWTVLVVSWGTALANAAEYLVDEPATVVTDTEENADAAAENAVVGEQTSNIPAVGAGHPVVTAEAVNGPSEQPVSVVQAEVHTHAEQPTDLALTTAIDSDDDNDWLYWDEEEDEEDKSSV